MFHIMASVQTYGMDDGANEVGVIDRFQHNLDISLQQTRFRKVTSLVSK